MFLYWQVWKHLCFRPPPPPLHVLATTRTSRLCMEFLFCKIVKIGALIYTGMLQTEHKAFSFTMFNLTEYLYFINAETCTNATFPKFHCSKSVLHVFLSDHLIFYWYRLHVCCVAILFNFIKRVSWNWNTFTIT